MRHAGFDSVVTVARPATHDPCLPPQRVVCPSVPRGESRPDGLWLSPHHTSVRRLCSSFLSTANLKAALGPVPCLDGTSVRVAVPVKDCSSTDKYVDLLCIRSDKTHPPF